MSELAEPRNRRLPDFDLTTLRLSFVAISVGQWTWVLFRRLRLVRISTATFTRRCSHSAGHYKHPKCPSFEKFHTVAILQQG
jgi:hypothetical protein